MPKGVHKQKMKLLLLLQVLVAVLEIGNTEDEPNTTIILNDSQTEMTVEQVKNPRGAQTNELFDGLREIESDGNDLDFDYDDGEDTLKVGIKNPDVKEQEMQEVLLKAMRKPSIRKQIGEVIPILRVMSPAQRLTLAALVSSQIMSENSLNEESLMELATMFANKKVENTDDRHNITEHLLLPISMDIAKMFKGLGKEMGRNLRQNFYRSPPVPAMGNVRRPIRKPGQFSINRRMDEGNYDLSEEDGRPSAEALKQPGKDECDYFTKSLCLEVSNYPTEAIILSLKRNQDIANTFLTDFEVQTGEERGHDPKNQGTGRRLERRQDDQNEVKDFPPQGSYMCPSSVKYARPKRARTTSGQWKYVVNAGDYTQTLRLEICQKPKSPCSYVTNHLNSECAQIYNYHRLLTWDENKGLHMDIFKVPSCCSCHIQGYSNFFPPGKDFTYAEKRREPTEAAAPLIPRDQQTEGQNRPLYGYLGIKREVPKHILGGNSLPQSVHNQTQLPVNPTEFYQNPVDHLVPPGPPLPLENEGIFNPYAGATYNQIQNSPEQNRRQPVQAEFRRTINKLGEEVDPHKEFIPNQRLKTIHERPKFTNPHHPEHAPHEAKPIFDSGNQIHFLKPAPNTLPPYSSLRDKPSGGTVFVTPHPQVHPPGSQTSTKQSPQYFRSEIQDSKSLPSRVNPSYVTPPKVKGIESRLSTTSPPPQRSELLTSSGQKKINYNYHPIIDFFLPDAKKKKSVFPPTNPPPAPQYLPLTSQDWTPVVGP